MRLFIGSFVLLAASLSLGTAAQAPSRSPATPSSASADLAGYIASLEEPDRAEWQKPDEVIKALRALNFHVLSERAGIDGFLQQGGTDKDTTELFGWIAYALAILASLIIAFNSLGLTQVTDLLGKVLLFVPRLLVALLVVVFGSYFARYGRS